MSAEEITYRGPCQGGLGDIYVTWSPIPEPGTATLLGLGLVGLAPMRKRASRLPAPHRQQIRTRGLQIVTE